MIYKLVASLALFLNLSTVEASQGLLPCSWTGKLPEFDALDTKEFVGQWYTVREEPKAFFNLLTLINWDWFVFCP